MATYETLTHNTNNQATGGTWPANLILDCVFDGLMPVENLSDIDAAVTDGYLDGLARGGWTGSADDVRVQHRDRRRREVLLVGTVQRHAAG